SGSSGPAGSAPCRERRAAERVRPVGVLAWAAMPAPGPAPLTLVTGPEALLRDRAVATAVAAVRAADPAADVTDVSAVGLEAGRVTGLASPSLFGGTTVIVVRDI